MTSTQAAPRTAEAVWAIRDARGLSTYAKAFLFVLASRGDMFASAETAAEDMGMSVAKFKTVSAELESRELVTITRRAGRPSIYTLNLEAVRELVPKKPVASPLRKVATVQPPSREVATTERPCKVATAKPPCRKVATTERGIATAWLGVATAEPHKRNNKKNEKEIRKNSDAEPTSPRIKGGLGKGMPKSRSSRLTKEEKALRESILDLLRHEPEGLFDGMIAARIDSADKEHHLKVRDACLALEQETMIHTKDLTRRYYFGPSGEA